MYNRYIPQPDGSYRRNTVADPPPKPPSRPPKTEEVPILPPRFPPAQEPPRLRPAASMRPVPPRSKRAGESTSIGTFLKQLLPKNFDTEDLLIILLLLLMSGDCKEDQNTALLTLVLYLFM